MFKFLTIATVSILFSSVSFAEFQPVQNNSDQILENLIRLVDISNPGCAPWYKSALTLSPARMLERRMKDETTQLLAQSLPGSVQYKFSTVVRISTSGGSSSYTLSHFLLTLDQSQSKILKLEVSYHDLVKMNRIGNVKDGFRYEPVFSSEGNALTCAP